MSGGRQRFSIIPAMAVTDQRLEPRDLQVLCLLGRHTNDLGWCSRSQVKMARELGCGRATVQRALSRLVEAGYVEHRAKIRDSGADAAHDYRVVIDPPEPETARENDPQGVPTGGQGCPPKDGQGVPTYGRAPMLTTPVKREERGARDGEPEEPETGQAEPAPAADPRALEKRVKRMAERLNWPNWAKSSTAWTVAQFAGLPEEDRQRAEERGTAYIAHCGKKALSLGMYFRERKFDDLPETAVKAAEEAETRVVAKPFGKLWGALRLAGLLKPHGPLPKASMFLETLMAEDSGRGERERLAHRARWGWPDVNRMHEAAGHFRGVVVSAGQQRLDPLAADFEQVRVGGDLWKAWEAEHSRRGWPWMPDPGRQEWVYFPKGGPDGLAAFAAAIENEEQDDDGGGREAAE